MEGRMIADFLEKAGIENRYIYIRTEKELVYAIDDFNTSNLRFLHLSLHGDQTAVSTTMDVITHKRLGELLEEKLKFRRLFLSACATVNNSLAKNVIKISRANSIIGPSENVDMDEIAVFWASFYHLMFKANPSAMKQKDLVDTLDKLVKLYNVPIKYYKKSTKSPYYREQRILEHTPKPDFTDFLEVD